MAYYREGGHTKYDCRYHIVRVTKYRSERINEELKEVIIDMLEEIASELFINIIRIGMEKDHVYMYVSIPLTTGYIPEVVKKLKGRTSKQLGELDKYKEYFKKFYRKEGVGKRAVGYFICTVGEVNDKLIKEYVEGQGQSEHNSNKAPSL